MSAPGLAAARPVGARSSAGAAYTCLLAFIVVVYSAPAHLFGGLGEVGYAKLAAALSLTALAGTVLLYDRPLRLGGAIGALSALLIGWVGLSTLWSVAPDRSRALFSEGLKYLAIFFVVVNVVDTSARLQRLCAFLATVTAVPALGCVVSYLRGEHLVDGTRAAWVGIFANPNDLAYHLVVGAALALATLKTTTSRRARGFFLALLGLFAVTIVLTGSRGGMLAMAAVLVLSLLSTRRRARTAASVALALGCLFMMRPGGVLRARNRGAVAFGEDVSARGRVDAWRTGMRMAAARPLTGVGGGAFLEAWPRYAPGDAVEPLTEHNTFVQLLAELGAPALLLFGAALALALTRRSPGAPEAQVSGVRVGLAGFSVCSLTGGLAFSWPLYLLFGLAAAAARLPAARPEPR
jgi:O-antigen ligase